MDDVQAATRIQAHMRGCLTRRKTRWARIEVALPTLSLYGQHVKDLIAGVRSGQVPTGSKIQFKDTAQAIVTKQKHQLVVDLDFPLGEGGYKKARAVHKLSLNRFGHSLESYAVLSPTKGQNVAMCHHRHRQAVDLIGSHEGMTAPGELQNDGTLVQPLYGKSVFDLYQELSLAEVLEIGITVAKTLQTLNQAGCVHRDVKGSNILGREGLLHDFDGCTTKPISSEGSDHRYDYWSFPGTLGLVTHADDVRGLLMTVCQAAFPGQMDHVRDDKILEGPNAAFMHFFPGHFEMKGFRGCRTPDRIRFNLGMAVGMGGPGEKRSLRDLAKFDAFMAILTLAHNTMQKEQEWARILVQSTVCHFAKIDVPQYQAAFHAKELDPIFDAYNKGVDEWFTSSWEGVDASQASEHYSFLLRQLDGTDLPVEERIRCLDAVFQYSSLLMLITHIGKDVHLPESKVGPELMANLLSDSLLEQAEGRKLSFELFPTAKEIGDKLSQILGVYNKALGC